MGSLQLGTVPWPTADNIVRASLHVGVHTVNWFCIGDFRLHYRVALCRMYAEAVFLCSCGSSCVLSDKSAFCYSGCIYGLRLGLATLDHVSWSCVYMPSLSP